MFGWDSQYFMPHGHCYLWQPTILWMHVVSDGLTALAYYSIPVALLVFIRRRQDLSFKWVFLLFAAFIFFCGSTHLFSIYTTWQPSYFSEGIIKAATAAVSVLTAALLWPMLPKALAIPSPSQLREKNEELERLNANLEMAVERRTIDSARLAAIVNSSAEGILAKDLQGHIVEWNVGAENLYGYSKEEVVGKSISIIFSDMGDEDNEHLTQKVLQSGSAVRTEAVRKTKSGDLIDIALTLSPIKDKNGEIVGISSISRDITQEKKIRQALEANERLMTTVITAIPTGILMVNEEGTIILSNPALEKMFGYAPAELNGVSVEALIPVYARAQHPELRRAFHRQPTHRQMGVGRELMACKKNGRHFPVEVGLAPMSADGKVNVLASVIDITERKQGEELLRVTNKQLRDTNSEMEQFVYAVSHDLKSPLVTSASFLSFLKEDLAAGNHEGVIDSISELENAHRRMKKLIDDLLELSRIGRVNVTREHLDLRAVANDVIDNLSEQLSDKGIRVKVSDDLGQIRFNRGNLCQVLENIVINAIKYASSVPDPVIEIKGESAGNKYLLCISDNGPGIDKRYHEKIFKLFQRLESEKEGSGLGLAIVARIMQTNGGRVWVESESGKGASFWLEFMNDD